MPLPDFGQSPHYEDAISGGASTSADIPVALGVATRVDLLLKRTAGVKLALIDAESRLPLSVASFRVVMATGQSYVLPDLYAEQGVITLPVDDGSIATLVVKANGYAYRTVRGLNPSHDAPTQLALTPGGRSFWLQTEGRRPCLLELIGGDGLPPAITLASNPGPVPLFAPSAFFTELEPGTYRVIVRACTGEVSESSVMLVPGQNPIVRLALK